MKKLIITVILLLIVFGIDIFFKRIFRKARKTKPLIKKTVTETEVVPDNHENKFSEVFSGKNAINVPKESNISLRETLDDTPENPVPEDKNPPSDEIQIIDLKNDNAYSLTFDEEEIYKGFIYSEIFRRKYK